MVLYAVCPSTTPYKCSDGSKCYGDHNICDRSIYCDDGTDESTAVCGESKTR
ncbi:hypothetical protein DPMN_170565 [Dreissena polymorpha]|uniref:Vitellogenin receptor n=1 Tax=Dreissena polymorpha TaxID=45954 RepID=A0A9D4DYU7_DREPO|nr:hypothetical protein DPMN_170565 [Dreissena polymorpha]